MRYSAREELPHAHRPPRIGTFTAPAVAIGGRVDCQFRGVTCVVTSISSAPIPWPRVQPLEQRGGCGLLVNETLARAIRTESAEALKHHFRASTTTVWAWRKCFGVGGRLRTLGSRSAQRAVSRRGAAAIKAKEWADEERDAKAAAARALGLRPPNRWTPERGGCQPARVLVTNSLFPMMKVFFHGSGIYPAPLDPGE